jgi:hypothetical protein
MHMFSDKAGESPSQQHTFHFSVGTRWAAAILVESAAATCRDEMDSAWARSGPDLGPEGHDCCVLWRLGMARGTAPGRRSWAQ